jgi:hypothetical protein
VYQLEETVIQTLMRVGITGERSAVNPGVWVGNRKIAAIGISASRWITMHGIALNISCDLSMYDTIIPCGILPEDGGVTSIAEELVRRQTRLLNEDIYRNDNLSVSSSSSSSSSSSNSNSSEGVEDMASINAHFRAAFSDVFQVDFDHIDSDSADKSGSGDNEDQEQYKTYNKYSLQNLMDRNMNSVDNDVLIPLAY